MTPETMAAPAAEQKPDVAAITTLPETKGFLQGASDLAGAVRALGTVRGGTRYLDTVDQREEASLLKAGAAKIRKGVEAAFKKPKDALNTLKGWVLDREKECLDLPLRIEKTCNDLCVEWDERQREIARKLEEDSRRERERVAEEERLRQAASVRETLLNEGAPIAEAEKAAMDVVAQPIDVGHVHYEPEIAKAKGEASRDYWHFEVEDETKVPREFCEPSSKKLQAYVNGFKGEAKVPGVKFWKETKISHRGPRS